MKLCNQRGQALPITLVLMSILVCMIAMGGERTFLYIQKVREQRKADAMAVMAANQQARALNAIAGLNKGLRIVRRNAYIVGLVTVALDACALACFFTLVTCPCLRPAIRLSWKMREFVPKINQLGEEIANAQDRILKWAKIAPERTILFSNILHEGGAWNYLVEKNVDLGGSPRALHLFRPGADDLEALLQAEENANEEAIRVANGGDISQCTDFTLRNNRDYVAFAREFRPERDSFFLRYQAGGQGVLETTEIVPTRNFEGNPPSYRVIEGSGQRCTRFSDIVRRNGGSSFVFHIPAPYILLPSFNEEQHIAIARQSRSRFTEVFDEYLEEDSNPLFHRFLKASERPSPTPSWPTETEIHDSIFGPNPMWSVSQARVLFDPRENMGELTEEDLLEGDSHCTMCDMNFRVQLQAFKELEAMGETIHSSQANQFINLGQNLFRSEEYENEILH